MPERHSIVPMSDSREILHNPIGISFFCLIQIRLGWHDAGTYRKDITSWPEAGGATASIRFKPELDHAANAGMYLRRRQKVHRIVSRRS